MTWTVGFDLDMTLIDSRPGVGRAIDTLAAEFDVPVRGADFAARLGPPLATLLVESGAPEELVPALVARYRELYPSIVPSVPAMPGAAASLAAVAARGGRVLVVTGKHEPLARLHIDGLGWRIDYLAGDLWSAGKATVLREQRANVFVGDHVGDMRGARAAGVLAVGVPTGPCDAEELRAAGADVILDDLTEFPRWLDEFGPVAETG
ncbi:phosphoglycolate phosphatase [Nocardia tenerifensis]|uniref:Phosphoglycolate phosphatase n=1 Tax=Nocardia tenerifensis TaxID=228006 RepID=A0A318KMN1_9NOCA|nr:HAD hydrolase-like protein [Nocardia tenerifensis]PXX70950.1 phosphoglycolate phosphatase [Nocardia tenerifensis]